MFRISLRIHLAASPTAGLTANASKEGQRVVVAEARKIEESFFSLSKGRNHGWNFSNVAGILQCHISETDEAAIHITEPKEDA